MSIIPYFLYKRVAHRPSLIKIIDNLSWLLIDKIARMGVGLVVGVWITRYLGPEQFGTLNFSTSFVSLFTSIAGLGLQGIVIRDLVRNPESKKETLGTAAVLQLGGGILSYLLIMASISIMRPDDQLTKLLVSILGTMMLVSSSEISSYWFESQIQSKYTIWLQNGSYLLFSAIKVLLILANAPLIAFAWVTLAESLFVSLIKIIALKYLAPDLDHLIITRKRAKELLTDSWPLLISGVLVEINLRFGQLMISQLLGNKANGIYAVASLLPQIVISVFMLAERSFYPINIKAGKQGDAALKKSIGGTYSLIFYGSCLASVVFILASNSIITLFFGQDYEKSGELLRILCLLLPVSALTRSHGQYCQATGQNKLILQRQTITTIGNLSLNWLLIPIYGALGGAYATLGAFIASFILMCIIDKQFLSTVVEIIKPKKQI